MKARLQDGDFTPKRWGCDQEIPDISRYCQMISVWIKPRIGNGRSASKIPGFHYHVSNSLITLPIGSHRIHVWYIC